jgi:hypothetical protein
VILLIAVGNKIAANKNRDDYHLEGMSIRTARVASLVTAMGWSDPATMGTIGTPQWQAAQWLGELDPYDLDFKELARTIEQILYPDAVPVSSADTGTGADTASATDQTIDAQGLRNAGTSRNSNNASWRSCTTPQRCNWLYELNFLSADSACSWHQMWNASQQAIDANNIGTTADIDTANENSTETLLIAVGADCLNGNLIKELILPANNLRGSLPTEIGLLTVLKEINLYGNGLTGTLPYTMAQLSELKYVSLHNNSLTGPLPESLLGDISMPDMVPDLVSLNLAHNQFTGKIPHNLVKHMTNLETLNLGNNDLQVPDLKELAVQAINVEYMPALRNLFLQGNNVHGTLGKDWVETHWAALR